MLILLLLLFIIIIDRKSLIDKLISIPKKNLVLNKQLQRIEYREVEEIIGIDYVLIML
jgi:hypothetical protein